MSSRSTIKKKITIKSALKGSTSGPVTVEMLLPKKSAKQTCASKSDVVFSSRVTSDVIIVPEEEDIGSDEENESTSDQESDSDIDSSSLSSFSGIHVDELVDLNADSFTIKKKKSKHKVRHDIYNLDRTMCKILFSYRKRGLYPPPSIILMMTRLQQYEEVTNKLVELNTQQKFSDQKPYAIGPRGASYTLDSSGNKQYIGNR